MKHRVGTHSAKGERVQRAERPPPRPQSAAEERANSISHGVGFVLAAAFLPALLGSSARRGGDPLQTVALAVFALTMMLVYLSSALFHGLPSGPGKRHFERLDRAAIYLFIAGSYTPFAASTLDGTRAWMMLALVWAVAALGVLMTLARRVEHPVWSTALYVAMGWGVLLAAIPLIEHFSPASVWLLASGGLAYTLGAAVYLLSARVPFAHLLWHLFVMAGSALHCAAALARA